MGKRGPKPKGGYPEKTKVLSTRITAALREELEATAARSGRSLSSEIEYRLRRSFAHREKMREVFGSEDTAAMMLAIASVINVTAQQAGGLVKKARGDADVPWLNDPYVYDQAVKAAIVIMEALRPPGDPTRPRMAAEEAGTPAANLLTQGMQVLGEGFTWGPGYALHLLRTIRDVEGDFPLPEPREDPMTTVARKLAADLGPITERLKKEESDE